MSLNLTADIAILSARDNARGRISSGEGVMWDDVGAVRGRLPHDGGQPLERRIPKYNQIDD